MNLTLLRLWLGRYGAAWFGAFLIILVGGLVGALLLRLDLIRLADVGLSAMLTVLSLGLVAFFAITLAAGETATTKVVLVLLGVILALPLLWAPVLAAVIDAWITKAPIEYSGAYAGFRIAVGRLLFPPTQFLFGGGLMAAAWSWFQALATIIGFIAAVSQLWPMLRRMVGAGQTAEG